MGLIEIILSGIALAMDAFAVSICKGLTLKKMEISKALICGIYFGIFQALMPLIGYFIGKSFITFVESFDHWIAFAILAIIGINMIRESFSKEEVDPDFSAKAMLILALATSIDALTMGLSFSMVDLRVNIFAAVAIIGVITFVLSGLGVFIGNIFGSRFNKAAQIIGGVCLVLIGVKVLLDGLGVL